MVGSWEEARSPQNATPVASVFVKAISRSKPVEIPKLTPETTVGDLKRMIALTLAITSRKHITLRRYGADVTNDEATLDELRVPDRAAFDIALRTRTTAELEGLHSVEHILLQSSDPHEPATQLEVSAETTVAQVKALLKANGLDLCFSPVFGSAFGTPLENDRTLGSYGCLDGDVFYLKSSTPADADAKAADAKPKGGKKR